MLIEFLILKNIFKQILVILVKKKKKNFLKDLIRIFKKIKNYFPAFWYNSIKFFQIILTFLNAAKLRRLDIGKALRKSWCFHLTFLLKHTQGVGKVCVFEERGSK